MATQIKQARIDSFETHPERYRHWDLQVDGDIATLTLTIEEGNGLRPDDYLLKLNSYDMGVDIELADAVQRLRFEHPQVRTVVFTSGLPRAFCAGANIPMLASSTHGWKVNFCKFTNETRLAIEEASRETGLASLAALNGVASGGGYELALACDRIYLIDDGSSAVSLPEVPLLGVLPGTGGLTRLVDKRKVRRDIADVFCTKAEGFRARDALRARIIDGSFPRSKWDDGIARAARELADAQPQARATEGVRWEPLDVERTGAQDDGPPLHHAYRYLSLSIDADRRVATLLVRGPSEPPPQSVDELYAQGVRSWAMQAFRELDDALLHLRFNHDQIGVVLLRTQGNAQAVLAHEQALRDLDGDWLADEIRHYQARVLRRLDNTARSFFALIDEESCFHGILFELALAADRAYMLEDDDGEVTISVTQASAGRYPMVHGPSRLQVRFAGEPELLEKALASNGPLTAPDADELGLVTLALDDIDWEDEVRIAIEERVSLSPDALTGMEQNLRFVGPKNHDLKIYGRLSAWQNWIFQRPNAVGEAGALTLYGHPERPRFDWRRT